MFAISIAFVACLLHLLWEAENLGLGAFWWKGSNVLGSTHIPYLSIWLWDMDMELHDLLHGVLSCFVLAF